MVLKFQFLGVLTPKIWGNIVLTAKNTSWRGTTRLEPFLVPIGHAVYSSIVCIYTDIFIGENLGVHSSPNRHRRKTALAKGTLMHLPLQHGITGSILHPIRLVRPYVANGENVVD